MTNGSTSSELRGLRGGDEVATAALTSPLLPGCVDERVKGGSGEGETDEPAIEEEAPL